MLPESIRSLLLVATCGTFVALSLTLLTSAAPLRQSSAPRATAGSIVGTWTGTSTCVGNRPACRNETVVYRFVPLDGRPDQLRLLADKIIDGKRVAMGAIVFDVDASTGALRGEFKNARTHGVWSFTVTGDSMSGTFVNQPDGTVVRDVKVHRAKDEDVPAAPPDSDYDE